MSVELTESEIDYVRLVEATRSIQTGAVVLFLGTVRELSEGKSVESLFYEAYQPMAEKQLAKVVSDARAKWPLDDCRVVHRHGRLELGDIAVAVVASSAHRAEAFEAARWVMDEIKKSVPIWKRETYIDREATWVHPVSSAATETRGK